MINVVNTKIEKFNVGVQKVVTPFTEAVVDTAEVATIKPTSADYKCVLEIDPGTGGDLTVTLVKGTLWAGNFDKVITVPAGAPTVIELEQGRFGSIDGTDISILPASGEALATVGAGVAFIETK